MNTIKIFLAEDGSVATLQKDFSLYQYEYQNKLLNVYVPTSICAGPFVDNNITTGYSCQIKCSSMTSGGKEKMTGNFYLRYVKTLMQNGVEYALFERLLPYAFTIYSGTIDGGNAPMLSISVVNMTYEDDVANVLSIVSTQFCPLEVNPSTQVQPEVPSDPDEIDTLFAMYSDLETNLALKQNADTTDDVDVINPLGDNHEVVANINDLIADNATNQGNIGTLQGEMTQARTDIENLYRMVGYGVNIVGTWTVQDGLPTDAQVTAKVEEITGNAPIRGQALLVRVDYTSGTDTIYLYVFDGTNWSHFEIQFLNDAANGVKGLIQGNYTIDGLSTSDNFMVDITSGQIVNIYRVDGNGDYTDLKTGLDQVIDKLINGNPVDKANKDGDGNVIKNTYQTKAEGATKTYVQDYASPKALYDLYYADFANARYQTENVNDTSYNKTTTVTQIGYTTLVNWLQYSLPCDVLLGEQNGSTVKFWIVSSLTESVKFRLSTAIEMDIEGVITDTPLSSITTDTIQLTANEPKLIQVEMFFDQIGSTPILFTENATFHQTIQVWREVSTSCDFTLLSNETYPSTETLNKIGFVRYSLEEEPSSFENGTGTIVDAGAYLRVRGTGKMGFANGEETNIQTQINIPVATSINGSDVTPPKTKDVYNAFANREVDVTSWMNTPLTADQEALITTAPLPNLKVTVGGNDYIYSPTYVSSIDIEWAYYNGPASTGFVTLYLSTHILSRSGMDLYHNIGIATDYAPFYSSSSTYAVGDLVMQEGILYQCNTAITTPESFTNAHWTRIDVETLLKGKQDKVTVDTTSTSPITLANNTSFRLGTISALTITNPSEYALDFECEIIFTADTGISMTYSAVAPTWSGDDVSGGVFTPVDGKTYNILFFNNATAVATPSIQAIVRGV